MTPNTAIIIVSASAQPYLSIGRRYGGFIHQGNRYEFIQEHDAFILDDYIKYYRKAQKQGYTWEEFIGIVQSCKGEKKSIAAAIIPRQTTTEISIVQENLFA
jgi:hypothetical protein